MKKSKIIWYVTLLLFLSLMVYYFYPEQKLSEDQKADKIIINKANHELLLYFKGELIASYQVSLSRNGLRKKTKSGDWLTPEGSFSGKKLTSTKFHRAISIGKWGDCCGVWIHGIGNQYGILKKFHRWRDWTKGCVALTNDEVEEIYKAVNNGVLIEINP